MGICFAVLFLAMHPDIQDKVYEEIIQVCENEHNELTYDKIKKLEYMDMVIKETLRLGINFFRDSLKILVLILKFF